MNLTRLFLELGIAASGITGILWKLFDDDRAWLFLAAAIILFLTAFSIVLYHQVSARSDRQQSSVRRERQQIADQLGFDTEL